MVTTGEIVVLAEWIIDDTCLVYLYHSNNRQLDSTNPQDSQYPARDLLECPVCKKVMSSLGAVRKHVTTHFSAQIVARYKIHSTRCPLCPYIGVYRYETVTVLIHSADPQSLPVVTIVLAHVVRLSPLFKI